MDAKAALLDRYVRPCLGHQLVFGDNLAGAVDEGDQDVKCPCTQRNSFVRLLEGAFGDIQLKWAENNPDCARKSLLALLA